jgi:hypothetical protein
VSNDEIHTAEATSYDGRVIVVLGNPGSRRVALFCEAARALGAEPPRVLSWLDFLADPAVVDRIDDPDAIFRIESPGQSFDVERTLLGRGRAAARALGCTLEEHPERLVEERGRIVAPRQMHLGFESALADLEVALAGRSWKVPTPPSAIRICFDKRETWRRARSIGVPVPDAIEDDLATAEGLFDAMRSRGWDRAYVKVSCASSASCLALVTLRGAEPRAWTTVETQGRRRYNTRRLRLVSRRPEVDALLGFLLGEGAQIEEAVDKARVDARPFDLRVLVVEGRATFVVARSSRHPITNLHLGGSRVDAGVVRSLCGPGAYDAAMRSAERLSTAIGAFQVGVDVALTRSFDDHRVIEANAFGDLLPGLQHEGLSVYGWQIRRLSSEPAPAAP